MGLTYLKIKVANVSKPSVSKEMKFLIDSGAIFSVVPKRILAKLKIKSKAKQEFTLANGEIITREKGVALFKYKEHIGGADVIFGEEGDSTLLGAFTLEALGLGLNPLKRELVAVPMMLA